MASNCQATFKVGGPYDRLPAPDVDAWHHQPGVPHVRIEAGGLRVVGCDQTGVDDLRALAAALLEGADELQDLVDDREAVPA